MAPDLSFFAMLFVLARSLAPGATEALTWVNGAQPDETLTWVAETSGGWELTVNGRELGVFHQRQGAVIHHQPGAAPTRYPLRELVAPVRADARRARLRGRFAPTVLTIDRAEGRPRLEDPSGQLLPIELTLRCAPRCD